MFYRYTKAGARISVDLEGLYEGETVFLLGGNPQLKELPLELLRQPGIVTLAMNNAPCVFERPTLWVTADRPECFSPHIYSCAETQKFAMISRRDIEVPQTGKKMRDFPSMYFYGANDSVTYENFLAPGRDMVWWRSVFPIALQLAHRLGFKRVFLVGCGFSMSQEPGKQYAWNTSLSPEQAQYSQGTYNKDLDRMRHLQPVFSRGGFVVTSSTPNSKANPIFGYTPLEEAVRLALEGKPRKSDTKALLHSSQLREMAVKQGEEAKTNTLAPAGACN